MRPEASASLSVRAQALVASPAVVERRAPAEAGWPFEHPEPEDVAALYTLTDGLELADGTLVLSRGELRRATDWLVEEKGLTWPAGIVVLGERAGVVVLLDVDPEGQRNGGGVVEAATDALESFQRRAADLLSYLEQRAEVPGAQSRE